MLNDYKYKSKSVVFCSLTTPFLKDSLIITLYLGIIRKSDLQ